MNILLIILLIVIGYGIYYKFINHIHINWNSFLKKGFKKFDNTFGLYCYVGKQRKRKNL